MGALPNFISISAGIGSQFNQSYQMFNDDGTLMSITNKIFEFVVRTDPSQLSAQNPVISVNSVSSTSSGFITVTTGTSTVLVSVSPTSMSGLIQQQYYYTLWMDQDLPDATALVSGTLFAANIAAQI
jgi:hypothetical protein